MPRLFVAVNFPSEVTEKLYGSAQYLKAHSKSANPSRKENLHLTLAFIGETNNIRGASSALREVVSSPFDITVEGYSEFSSHDGSICYAKTKGSDVLCSLAENVRNSLVNKGFQIDTKPFRPHITLCRQFIPSKLFSQDDVCKLISTQTISVKEISLMRSDRINGKLTYTEVYKKIL